MKKFNVDKLDMSIPIRSVHEIPMRLYPEDITDEINELFYVLTLYER